VNVSALAWLLTGAWNVALFAFEFVVIARRPHTPTFRESAVWAAIYISLALQFGVIVWLVWGVDYGAQYFAGYVTEYALSADNLFVFAIIFSTLAIPREGQQKALLIGIAMALVLRGLFIAAGAAAIGAFSWVFYLFGALLIWTAYKLIREHGREEEDELKLIATVRRITPSITPMMLALVVIGIADAVFALDSIPAIYGLTTEPYIVFTANAFALMGLQQMYFLISGLLDRLVYLSYGLALILAFIGAKLLLHAMHEANHLPVPEISTGVSLAVIASVLAVTTVASLIRSRVSR